MRSTRSFIRSPEWPFTHWKVTGRSGSKASGSSSSHRSRLATGLPWALRQPRRFQPTHHRLRKQFTTYVESLITCSGPGTAWRARVTAVTSIRWLVVWASPPLSESPPSTAHAHPPGPGFPRHEPSV